MKLNYKRTIFVGMAFMAICAFWQIYDSLVPKMLIKTFQLSEGMIGAGGIMALDNVLALFMLPLFGAVSDRTKTRIGKRMPYIIAGTVLSSLTMLLLPLGNQLKIFPLFFTGLLVTLVIMSVYRSPAVALMPTVTPKPLRSKANAVINLMGAAGGIITLAAIRFMVPSVSAPNYFPVFVFVALLMDLCLVVLCITIKEPKLTIKDDTDEKEEVKAERLPKEYRRSLILILLSVFAWFMGYNAVTTWFSTYGEVVWGLKGGSFAFTLIIAQISAIASYIPAGFLAGKIGRKKAIMVGVILLACAFLCAAFFRQFSIAMYFIFVLAGMGWATINVSSYPMVVELATAGNVGKFTGYYYTFSMAAQILTPILSGEILKSSHLGYKFLFPYATVCVVISLITMIFVKHGDTKPEAHVSIEAFDVE